MKWAVQGGGDTERTVLREPWLLNVPLDGHGSWARLPWHPGIFVTPVS